MSNNNERKRPSKSKDSGKESDENQMMLNIVLRDKFLDFSHSIENEIFSLVEARMKSWREEFLPLGVNNVSEICKTSSFSNKKKLNKTGELPSRIFIPRQSLLNELFAVSHIQSVYNIFVAILFILLLQEVGEEVMETGSVDLELSYMYWAFGKFDKALVLWLLMKISTMVGVYLGFHFWAHHRMKSPRVFDVIGGLLYITYLSLFIYLPVRNVLINEYPPASSVAILCEQVRLFMKTWAFVRSNIKRVLNFKKDDSASSQTLCPDFSHYIFFLFVPTLVYRDAYPRNSSCNWKKVAKEFAQVIGCIFYMHFLLTRFCGPVFRKFGREEFSPTKLFKAVFSSCFPGFIVLLCGFFLVLHSWMNAFAEMLRFADRMFYKDWWNSTSYPRFYRTWNCVVHDWLYEYVYKELSDSLAHKKGFYLNLKFLPMFVVFFISSAVHEYILAFSFKFFYPVLLIMFGGFGLFFMFINTKDTLFNVFIWVSLILGTGILMCMYTLEWYARINCPPVVNGIGDYFVPRSWFCYS